MADSDKPTYALEPDDEGTDAPTPGDTAAEADAETGAAAIDDASDTIEVSRGVEPLPLEEVDLSALPLPDRVAEESEEKPTFKIEEGNDSEESDYVHRLDICPNCGKSMGSVKNLVCLNCGFDLKTMKVIRIKTGVTTEEEEKAKQPRKPKRLCKSTRFDPWLPVGVFGGAMLVMLIGYAAGASGIATIAETGRFKGFLIEIGLVLLWGGAATGALMIQSRLLERPLGDVELMFMRIAAIVGVSRIPTLIEAPNWIEAPFEWLVAIGLTLPIAMRFVRMTWRDALLYEAIAILIYLPVRGITTLL